MKWRYEDIETLEFSKEDPRNGNYFRYKTETINQILNDSSSDEYDWIIDSWDDRMESCNGIYVYVPCFDTKTRIDITRFEFELQLNWGEP